MRRREFIAIAALSAATGNVLAQGMPYRVAYVTTERKGTPSANLEAFRAGTVPTEAGPVLEGSEEGATGVVVPLTGSGGLY